MKQSIIKIDANRKLAQGAYGELQGRVPRWFSDGTHVELHGRGVDCGHPYVYGTANGLCVRFYDQQRYADNSYRMAGEEPPTEAEFEARIQKLLRLFQ